MSGKVSLELDEVPGLIAVIFMGEQCFVTRALSSGPGYSTHCVTPVCNLECLADAFPFSEPLETQTWLVPASNYS